MTKISVVVTVLFVHELELTPLSVSNCQQTKMDPKICLTLSHQLSLATGTVFPGLVGSQVHVGFYMEKDRYPLAPEIHQCTAPLIWYIIVCMGGGRLLGIRTDLHVQIGTITDQTYLWHHSETISTFV
ncbi:hypothetical protein TNCV_3901561 [Trichonephila clavipes]|nr:hypothetical protein TNCV_3901561 [Trichonephila clavipes]